MSVAVCKRIAVLTLVWIGLAVPASAQIYSWRDANGTLVLSDRRPPTAPDAVRSYRSTAQPDRPRDALRRGGAQPALRRFDHRERPPAGRPSRPRARGDAGGVGVQPARAIAERRARPHAADAGNREAVRRHERLRPLGECPRRRQLSSGAVGSVRQRRNAGACGLQRRSRRRGQVRAGGAAVSRNAELRREDRPHGRSGPAAARSPRQPDLQSHRNDRRPRASSATPIGGRPTGTFEVVARSTW